MGEGVLCLGALERPAARRTENTTLVRPGHRKKARLRYRKAGIPIHSKGLGRTECASHTRGRATHEEAPHLDGCPLVFPSRSGKPNYRFLHDRCKAVAKRAGLNPDHWYLHRFRDTAATRWLRAGIDVRTVQSRLGHESLETTQKYLEPSTDTERQLARIALPL